MRKQRRTLVIVALSTLFIVFSLLYIISCIIILSVYAKLPSHGFAIRERGRVAVNMQGTVFTIARLIIVPTIMNLICRCHLYDSEM